MSEPRLTSKLIALRESQRCTQQDLSQWAGISVKTIARLERGDIGVKLRDLVRVSAALGVAPIEILPALRAKPRAPRALPKKGTAVGGSFDRSAAALRTHLASVKGLEEQGR